MEKPCHRMSKTVNFTLYPFGGCPECLSPKAGTIQTPHPHLSNNENPKIMRYSSPPPPSSKKPYTTLGSNLS